MFHILILLIYKLVFFSLSHFISRTTSGLFTHQDYPLLDNTLSWVTLSTGLPSVLDYLLPGLPPHLHYTVSRIILFPGLASLLDYHLC